MKEKKCEHIKSIETVNKGDTYECEECAEYGGTWVHLRTCQVCGVTLCCDSSPAKHITRHNHTTGHKVIASAEPGEQWLWCYEHEAYAKY